LASIRGATAARRATDAGAPPALFMCAPPLGREVGPSPAVARAPSPERLVMREGGGAGAAHPWAFATRLARIAASLTSAWNSPAYFVPEEDWLRRCCGNARGGWPLGAAPPRGTEMGAAPAVERVPSPERLVIWEGTAAAAHPLAAFASRLARIVAIWASANPPAGRWVPEEDWVRRCCGDARGGWPLGAAPPLGTEMGAAPAVERVPSPERLIVRGGAAAAHPLAFASSRLARIVASLASADPGPARPPAGRWVSGPEEDWVRRCCGAAPLLCAAPLFGCRCCASTCQETLERKPRLLSASCRAGGGAELRAEGACEGVATRVGECSIPGMARLGWGLEAWLASL
jgi:hypothetical protein